MGSCPYSGMGTVMGETLGESTEDTPYPPASPWGQRGLCEEAKPMLGLKGDKSWPSEGKQCSRQREKQIQRMVVADHSALKKLREIPSDWVATWEVGDKAAVVG